MKLRMTSGRDEREPKQGDVVKLASGGPQMTVCKISDDGNACTCVWFPDHASKPERSSFETYLLVIVTP
jgi:uncharacterized protein YodC (DUF2158 family)